MLQDRLQEVKGSFDEKDLEDIEMANNSDSEMPAGLQDFYDQIAKIKELNTILRMKLDTLTIAYRNTLLQTSIEEDQDFLNRELEASIELQIKSVVRLLKQLSEENKRAEGHIKLRTNLHSLVTKQFMELVGNFRNMQNNQKERIKLAMIQRVMLVKPDATSEELDSIVSGTTLSQLTNDVMLKSTALDSLQYVEHRHEEILKIENSVAELHQIFVDMAILVESQGNFIDHIDTNVNQTVENIEKANQQLANAVKYRKRMRRTYLIICVLILLLLGAGVVVILSVGGANNFWKK